MKDSLLMKEYLGSQIEDTRKLLDITQEKMAELLHISPRSYNALKHQQYGVSATTLLFFLQLLTDEQMVEFVRGFTHKSEDK